MDMIKLVKEYLNRILRPKRNIRLSAPDIYLAMRGVRNK